MTLTPTLWNAENTPVTSTLDAVLASVRNDDILDGLLYEPLTLADVLDDVQPEPVMDAIVVENMRLSAKMQAVKRVINSLASEPKLKIKDGSPQISEPFTKFGTANVAVLFELEGGQTISIFFHNPDTTPRKITGSDMLISYKFLLNKKDITIVVAPERGQDIDLRQVAIRILKLAEKNQATFERRNAKRTEQVQRIAELKQAIEAKRQMLNEKLAEIAKLEEAKLTRELRAEIEQEDRENALQAVNSAYQFANATDDLKEFLFESLNEDNYSPFLSAKNIDSRVKMEGGEVEWSLSEDYDVRGVIKLNNNTIGRIDMGSDGRAVILLGETGNDRVKALSGSEMPYTEELDSQRYFLDRLFAGVAEQSARQNESSVKFASDGGEYLLYGTDKEGHEQLLFKVENKEQFEMLKQMHSERIKADGFTNLREKVYQNGVYDVPNFAEIIGVQQAEPASTFQKGNISTQQVTITGNELGDFDTSTEEGKKALREAAFNHLVKLADDGDTVFCKAVNAEVGFNKAGAKKFKSLGANPIKNQLAAAIKLVIQNAELVRKDIPSYDTDEQKRNVTYSVVKTKVAVNGEEYGVRTVLRKLEDGQYQYDVQVKDNFEMIMDSVNENGLWAARLTKSDVPQSVSNQGLSLDCDNTTSLFDSVQAENVKSAVAYANSLRANLVLDNVFFAKADLTNTLEVLQNNLPISVKEGNFEQAKLESEHIQSIQEALAVIDSVGENYVLNLFVYDKDGNLIEDEEDLEDSSDVESEQDSETTQPDEDKEQMVKEPSSDIQFLQDVIDGKVDVLSDDFYPKFEEINNRLFAENPELVEKAVNAYIAKTDEYAQKGE